MYGVDVFCLFDLAAASFLAAALSLATCTISSLPPKSVRHTCPGLALQRGHDNLIGLTATLRIRSRTSSSPSEATYITSVSSSLFGFLRFTLSHARPLFNQENAFYQKGFLSELDTTGEYTSSSTL